MNPMGQTARLLIGVLLLTLASFTFSTCGGTGTDLAGGGVSGTGVSTGSITGFGSVVMNGVHYLTDSDVAPGFVTHENVPMGMDNSSMTDRDLFRVGMVVTIHHGPNDNNAQQIEYQDNLQGRIAAKNSGANNTVTVLGQTVVVDNAAVFASLNLNELVEVSGFVDSAGRIRASYIAMVPCSMMMGMCTASEFEVKGYVSGLSSSGFRLGPLPGGTGTTVAVSFAPGVGAGLADGMYVQVVTTDPQPVSGVITATRIDKLSPRTVFPEKARVDLEGLVTASPSGSGNVLSFAVEGKRVQTDGSHAIRRGHGGEYSTRREIAGPGYGERRGSLRRQNHFPVDDAGLRAQFRNEQKIVEGKESMRTPAETCRKMLYLLFALTLSIALAACGGGGATGGNSSGQSSTGGHNRAGSAVIQGKVSGTGFHGRRQRHESRSGALRERGWLDDVRHDVADGEELHVLPVG